MYETPGRLLGVLLVLAIISTYGNEYLLFVP